MSMFDRMHAERPGIVIVGLGSLGSMVFSLLTRETLGPAWSWAGRVFLTDMDSVLPHNLVKSSIFSPQDVGRKKVAVCQSWSQGINPDLQVVALSQPVEAVEPAVFANSLVVFICADTYQAKMVAGRQAWRAGVPLIMVGEMAGGDSQDSRCRWYHPGPEAPCQECNWEEEYHQLDARFPCSPADPERRGPATRLTVAARTAAYMLEEAERQLLQDPGSHPAQEVRFYPAEGRTLRFYPKRNPDCLFDHNILDRQSVVSLPGEPADQTLGSAFAEAEQHLREVADVAFGQAVATWFACPGGHEWSRLQRLALDPPICPECGQGGVATEITFCLSRDMAREHPDTPLLELCRPGDLLAFRGDSGQILHLALPGQVLAYAGAGSTAREGIR